MREDTQASKPPWCGSPPTGPGTYRLLAERGGTGRQHTLPALRHDPDDELRKRAEQAKQAARLRSGQQSWGSGADGGGAGDSEAASGLTGPAGTFCSV